MKKILLIASIIALSANPLSASTYDLSKTLEDEGTNYHVCIQTHFLSKGKRQKVTKHNEIYVHQIAENFIMSGDTMYTYSFSESNKRVFIDEEYRTSIMIKKNDISTNITVSNLNNFTKSEYICNGK